MSENTMLSVEAEKGAPRQEVDPRSWSVILPLVAIAALALVYGVDRLLWNYSRTVRAELERKSVEQALKLVKGRLAEIKSDLSQSKQIAEAAGQKGPSQVAGWESMTLSETLQWRASLIAEGTALQRQESEVQAKLTDLKVPAPIVAPIWLARAPTWLVEDLARVLDQGSYSHGAFHVGAVGATAVGWMAITAILLAIFGNRVGLNAQKVWDLISGTGSKSGSSGIIAPLVATLAGAGAVTLGAAGVVLARPESRVGSETPTQISNVFLSPQGVDAIRDAREPLYLALVVQPTLERTERITREITKTIERLEGAAPRAPLIPALRIDGEVKIAGHKVALEELIELQRQSNVRLDALAQRAEGIETQAGKIDSTLR